MIRTRIYLDAWMNTPLHIACEKSVGNAVLKEDI